MPQPMIDADAIVIGAGLAGLVATAELVAAGRRVILLEQEPEASFGGQAWWSSPEVAIDRDLVRNEVVARDREFDNDFSKDAQNTAIRQARHYLGDKLIRVAAPHKLLDPKAGPLIAVKLHILTRKSLGGIETDLDGQVLAPDGSRISGLFAAGEASGFGGGVAPARPGRSSCTARSSPLGRLRALTPLEGTMHATEERLPDSSVMARLRAAMPVLGPSERRVAQAILARPAAVTEWSTAELAHAAETSPATVVRACQTLGFRGFQHLRLEIARAAPSELDAGPGAHPLTRVFADAADAIAIGRDSVDVASVDAAVDAIARARRLVLVGTGFSAPPLQDAAMRFATIGRPVEAPSDVLGQQFAAHSLTAGDVCLTVSYSGANTHTLSACRAAKEGGADVIAVTSFARSPLTQLADIALVTGPLTRAHDVDPFLSRLSHLLVLHTLHTALLARTTGPDFAQMRDVVAEALVQDE
jgi:RpiR family carbohydrate utilization transcriptional regulator